MELIKLIGERSEPPPDKLGGDFFISSHALVCCHYKCVHVRPDNQYHAHLHCVRTLTLTDVACAITANKNITANSVDHLRMPLPKRCAEEMVWGHCNTTTCSLHQHSGTNRWYSLIVVGVSSCFAIPYSSFYHLFSVFIEP